MARPENDPAPLRSQHWLKPDAYTRKSASEMAERNRRDFWSGVPRNMQPGGGDAA
jgi:hypothetical protein